MHFEESSESVPLLFTASKRTVDILWNLNIPSGEKTFVH